MGRQLQLLYLRKSTDNSLHFEGLRRMLFEIAYDSISLTTKFKIEGEFLGTTSRTVKSSTYFALGAHDETRSLTIIASKRGLSLVPWGIPPFKTLAVEVESMRLMNCVLPSKKAATHLSKALCTSNPESLCNRMLWSTKSKAFRKSAKNYRAEQLPRSRFSRTRWRIQAIACSVDFQGVANCLASRSARTAGASLDSVSPPHDLWYLASQGDRSNIVTVSLETRNSSNIVIDRLCRPLLREKTDTSWLEEWRNKTFPQPRIIEFADDQRQLEGEWLNDNVQNTVRARRFP